MNTKRKISESATGTAAAPARAKHTRRTKAAAAPPPVEAVAMPATETAAAPAYEEVARLAYSYWETRGYQGGSPEEDWLRAEAELSKRV
jgi:hypothetical protein